MVLFEAGHEAEAAQAAIDILQAIDAQSDMAMTVGIGIHSGEAVVGSIGTVSRRDYTAIGDTINIGARICAACPRDTAYVSAAVFARLESAQQSRFSAHDMLHLKGKTEAIEVHGFTLNQEQ